MLKRFLKFFKNDDQEAPEFEGSYLDFLLTQVEPGVIAELDDCEEHDPLLLVIAEILRISMRGAWSPTIRRPLIDEHSPRSSSKHAPPPPPPTPPVAPDAAPDASSSPEESQEQEHDLEDDQLVADSEPIDETDEFEEVGSIPLDAAPEEKSTSKTREYKTPAALRDAMSPSEEEEGVVPDADEADGSDDGEEEEGAVPGEV